MKNPKLNSENLNIPWEQRIQDAMNQIPSARYPIIIELAGLPRLGKTTFSDSLVDLLRQSGFKVRLCSFATYASPIDDRWTFDFSAWTFFSFLGSYLELKNTGIHFIVADRGLFDALIWLRVKMEDVLCDESQLSIMRNLSQSCPWFDSLCVVLAFLGRPEIILGRFNENKLYKGESQITTKRNLLRLTTAIKTEAKLWKVKKGPVDILNTNFDGINSVMKKATEIVVASLEDFSTRQKNF